jgi:hypothetical protein
LKSRSKTSKYDKSDWFCKPCGKHFPKADNHAASCTKAKAAAAASAGGRPRP